MSCRPPGIPNVAGPPGLEDEAPSTRLSDLVLGAGIDATALAGVAASAPANANAHALSHGNGLTNGFVHGSAMHGGLGYGFPRDVSTCGSFANGANGLVAYLQQQQQHQQHQQQQQQQQLQHLQQHLHARLHQQEQHQHQHQYQHQQQHQHQHHQQQHQQQRLLQVQQSQQQRALDKSGEWVEAVLSAAPLMDSAGIKEALAILDNAVSNIQQIKALDGIISSSYMAGGMFTRMPHLHAAESMKAQVFERQQILLRQLHHLRARATVIRGQAFHPASAPNIADQTRISQHMAQQEDLRQLSAGLMSIDDRTKCLHALLQERQHRLQTTPEMLRDDRLHGLSTTCWQEQHQQWGSQEMKCGRALTPWPAEQPPAGLGKPTADIQSRTLGRRSNGQASGCQIQTLSSSMQLLANEDPNCLFIVRRINKLGFKAARKLKQHFSSCGVVVRVLVAHSTIRRHDDAGGNRCQPRRRPSSLGFVHMATREAVYRVLALGEEQQVENWVIRVQKFERPRQDELEEEDEEDQDEQETDDVDELTTSPWNRQQSALSMADSWKRQQSSISTRSTNWENDDEEWKRQQSTVSAKSTGSGDSGYSKFEGSLAEDSSEQ